MSIIFQMAAKGSFMEKSYSVSNVVLEKTDTNSEFCVNSKISGLNCLNGWPHKNNPVME